MVVEMSYGTIAYEEMSFTGFQSDIPASDIIEAYKSGKNVLFHFIEDSAINSYEAAVSMIGYYAEFDTGAPTKNSPIQTADILTLGENITIEGAGVVDDIFCVIVTPASSDSSDPVTK